MRGLMTRRLRAASTLALLLASASHAQELTVAKLEHYTDNRGWNEAGLGPAHQVIVTATVTPAGLPTLVYAEKDGAREPLTHFPQPGAWQVLAVRGNPRVHGRFMSQLYVSGDLPPTATSYTIPAGVLAAGERYVFQVMLEDLEAGVIENRSLSFSEPFTPAR